MTKIVWKQKSRSTYLPEVLNLKLGEQKKFLDTRYTCGHGLCEVYGTCEDCCQCGNNNCGTGRYSMISKIKNNATRKVINFNFGDVNKFVSEYKQKIDEYKIMEERMIAAMFSQSNDRS